MADRLHWFLLWLAYRAVLILPLSDWRGRDFRLTWKLLPYAGQYAYTEGGFAEFRREKAAGRFA